MKKLLMLLAVSTATAQIAQAQNLKTVNALVILGKMDDAKVEIDKVVKDPKLQTKAETWFLQYKIYASFVKTPNGKIDITQAANISDAAFEKYISMEKDMTLLKENNGSTPIFEMYSTFNATAVNAYNGKKYDSAGYYFSKAVDYIDKIVKYKWSSDTKLAFDTISILYAGVAYENAKKTNEAVKYYARLVEAKVGGKDYIGLYRYLLLNAVDNKNEANFKKYLAFSKEMYPNENWEVYELEFFSKALSLQEKTAKYESDDASGNLSSLQYAYYGEAFANASKEPNFDSTKLDFYKSKAIQAFKKASDKKPEDGLAAYNVGVLSYNQFIELDEKRRENTRKLQALNANRVVEKDPKKKAASDAAFKTANDELKKSNADLEAPTSEYVQVSLTYLENAFKILKDKKDKSHQEKNCLGRSVDFLSNLYAYKRDKARGKDPKAYDAFEAKYKFYDELHGKF